MLNCKTFFILILVTSLLGCINTSLKDHPNAHHNSAFYNKKDISHKKKLSNTSLPQFLYKIDTRSPSYVFSHGIPSMGNKEEIKLVNFLIKYQNIKSLNFILTTTNDTWVKKHRNEFAYSYHWPKFIYIYTIRPTAAFFNIKNIFDHSKSIYTHNHFFQDIQFHIDLSQQWVCFQDITREQIATVQIYIFDDISQYHLISSQDNPAYKDH